VPDTIPVGSFVDVVVTGADGPDLYAELAGVDGSGVDRLDPAVAGAVR
jgi:hypothetical protein